MRRTFKIIAATAAGLLVAALLLCGGLFIAGNTGPGRAMIEQITERLTAGQVKLSGLAGSFPQHLFVEKLELSDGRGVWLTAERVTLDWSPLAFLTNRLQVDSLLAARIDMQRTPQSSPTADSKPVSIPRIDVARMSVDLLELGPELAGAPAALTLRGSAHLRSVQDMVIDADARRIDGTGSYALHLRFDTQRMDAALNVREPANGPLENLLRLPGLGALSATLNLSGPRSAERLDLSVDAGALRARAAGTMNLTELHADLDFDVESPALQPREDLGWDSASLKGRWHGSLNAPVADGHVEFVKLRVPGGTQMARLNADLAASSGKATLQALVEGLLIPGPEPRLLRDSPVKIEASLRLDEAARPLDLSASHRLFTLRARADTAGMSVGRQNATLELRLSSLGALAALTGQDIRGNASLKADVKGDERSMHVALDASAGLVPGTASWSALVGERATLNLSGVITDKAMDLQSMKFSGRSVSLTASGGASRPTAGAGGRTPSKLRLRWELGVTELRALSAALEGTARASGTLEGPLTALSVQAHLASTLSVRGSPSSSLSADIKLRDLPKAPSGTLQARGSLEGEPLSVDVAALRDPSGSLRVLIQQAEWKSGHVDGDLRLAANAGASGRLLLRWSELGDLRHLLGVDLGGSLSADLMLRPEQGRTHAQFHLDAKNLSIAQAAGNLQITGEGVTDALALNLSLQAPDLYGAAASASAAGTLNLNAGEVSVASMTASYRGEDFRLLSPAKVAFADGVSVDVLKVGAQKAVFQLRGKISPTLDVLATLRDVQPSLVNVFAPRLLESGTIDVRAELKGSLAAPEGRVRLNATGMRMADDAALGLPALDLRANVDLMGNTAAIDARMAAGDASKLNVTGHAPLAVDGELDLKIKGTLDLGMANPFLEARGQHATGQLAVDAVVAGSAGMPEISGTVNLTKGSLRDYGRGIGISDMDAEIEGSQGALQIKHFTAAAAPGTFTMTGTVGVLQKGIPVDLKIKADNAQPIVSKLVTANLNADLHVTGTARERLDIAGTVRLNRTLIGIPNSLPPNVAVLDVRRRGKKTPVAPGKVLTIGLDVAVRAPQEILVQGRGLDAEMGGSLRLNGTLDAPLVTGGFDLQRGSFALASNRLNFTAGRVSFNGAGLRNKIDPTLDFTAQTTLPDATATLRITGLADAPQFEFTSTPALPQDEIMARLLFGTNAAQLSGLQLAQIGAALASLSGVGGDGGLNPLVKLQRSLGLDRLTVGAGKTSNTAGTENSGASIEAGRYISKRVYVEAKQTTAGTSQLEADVDLTKHLKLQTKLGNGTASVQGTTPENDPGSSVGLSYQFEY